MVCECGNEILNTKDMTAIEVQWTINYGCDKCKKFVIADEDPIEEVVVVSENKRKSRF